ncbi:protein L-Myc-like isoform X2 [Petromyzon marinus]|uniref:N-myc proto-oncogene protein-like isoform X2 n=1 Tax=Petromyzon marinus TaxID=7757 RepID=A0AAJ7WW23_PETMA|nr:N-myc proto-oncogene protein-like isoform X2 [Petromyzon marinus]
MAWFPNAFGATVATASWPDSEHECGYFYDDPDEDDELFRAGSLYCAAPGEHIWKKFQLLLGPGSGSVPAPGPLYVGCPASPGFLTPPSPQRLVDEGDVAAALPPEQRGAAQASPWPVLVRDCMWGGAVAAVAVQGSAGAGGGRGVGSAGVSAPRVVPPELGPLLLPSRSPSPAYGHARARVLGRTDSVGSDSDGGSTSASDSESEDDEDDDHDDDDDDDDDDEIIDVVTVGKHRTGDKTAPASAQSAASCRPFALQVHQEQHNYSAPSPPTRPVAAPLNSRHSQPAKRLAPPPALKSSCTLRCKSRAADPVYEIATTVKSPTSRKGAIAGPSLDMTYHAAQGLRPCVVTTAGPQCGVGSPPRHAAGPSLVPFASCAPASAACSDSGFTSGSGDDSDEHGRRRNHNFLERQRREDLKRSFRALRDEVPELAGNEKAAKVVILRKAAESAVAATRRELGLLAEKEQLRVRRAQLQRRLLQLKKAA